MSKTFFLLSFLLVLGACEKKEMVVLNPDANTVASLSASTLVLLEDDAANDAVVVSWTDPDFGYDAAPTYRILIDFAGGDFSAPQVVVAGTALQKVMTVGELNGKLLSLGLTPEEATDVDFVIETKLSTYKILYSEPVTMTVTAYSTLLDLSTNWGIVGNATPGGWGSTPSTPIKDIPFWTTGVDGIYVAYGKVRDGFIKFRTDNAWTTNYGDTGNDGTLEAGGSDIPITPGTYKFTMNLNTLTYTIEPFTWGIVGSGTLNGWGAPDTKLYYNSYANDWRTVATLLDGEIKFRLNESWDAPNPNYGGSGGTLVQGGDNIPVTAGQYLVTFDPINLTYSLEAMDVWGLVGDGTPTGWATLPDTKFIPDFGINEGVYYIHGITLTDPGFVKVRQNDAWTVNYGDNGNDGSLELNGADIPVPASGIYNVEINMNDPKEIHLYPWQ